MFMSSDSRSPYARIDHGNIVVNALKYMPEKDSYRNVGKLELGTEIRSEKQALRKLFMNMGEGLYAFTSGDMTKGETVSKLWKGRLTDSDPYLVFEVAELDSSEEKEFYTFFEDKGLKPLDYGQEGYARVKKFPEEEDP